jgi:hypothetical protein
MFVGARAKALFGHTFFASREHSSAINGNFRTGTTTMKKLFAAAFLVAMTASGNAATAGQCQDDVAKIDALLSGNSLDTDQRAQLEDMRNQAVQLCGAGNEEEGLAVTAEAKATFNIE